MVHQAGLPARFSGLFFDNPQAVRDYTPVAGSAHDGMHLAFLHHRMRLAAPQSAYRFN
jgi:hypothetical protein